MESFDTYQTPLSRCVLPLFFPSAKPLSDVCLLATYSRYASKEMAHLFSAEVRILRRPPARQPASLLYL